MKSRNFANLSFGNSTYGRNFADKTFGNFPKSSFLGTKPFANHNVLMKKIDSFRIVFVVLQFSA